MNPDVFLIEIGCEELPAQTQQTLPTLLAERLTAALTKANLSYTDTKTFVTPRRIAVMVNGLETAQAAQIIERQGPSLENAYDKNGSPTVACLGFAKSCNASMDELCIKETPKGKRVVYLAKKPGIETVALLPQILTDALDKLPMSKPMRWGNHDITFIRPVHWIVALFGETVIPVTLFGVAADRYTTGHRFHHPKALRLNRAQDYAMLLYSQGYVIADFETRKNTILKSMKTVTAKGQHVVHNDALQNEVTALVEWPVVLKGTFDPDFLAVPKEVLITSMETHQKCFPVENQDNQLQPYFVLVSNIESKDPYAVIKGNERVIRARLSDAQFFYQQDQKTSLSSRLPRLDHVIFQDQLGSLGDKTKRIVKLATLIAKQIQTDVDTTVTAAKLCKCDLVTEMVYEFPNLQGIMGYYYALHDHLPEKTALAIREHYLPRFSGDALPSTLSASCVALADRLDSLVGILGINKIPTGDKDPFALRRAALGALRIMIEKALPVDLVALLKAAKSHYTCDLPNQTVVDDTFKFMMSRLKAWYTEQNIALEVFESVNACQPTAPFDFDRRVKAVIQFQKLPEAESLAAANKRVSNILKKEAVSIKINHANNQLFELDAERALAAALDEREKVVNHLYGEADYEKALFALSSLKSPIDQFFDNVMIMVDDKKIRQNRLALLINIRNLFTKVADISLLP